MSIFPDVANGGIIVRTIDGTCVAQSETPNAYCPPPGFVVNCNVTALAEDCSARVMPSQINAIVSELLCLAVTWDPNGPWDCNSNCNLATMFSTWAANFSSGTTIHVDNYTIKGTGLESDPLTVNPIAVASMICQEPEAREIIAECLVSTDPANLLRTGQDGRLFVTVATSSPLIGSGTNASPLTLDFEELISEEGLNVLRLGDDGKLYAAISIGGGGLSGNGTPEDPLVLSYDVEQFIIDICQTELLKRNLVECLISQEILNILQVGPDGGIYAISPYSGDGIFNGNQVLFEISFSRAAGFEDDTLLSAYVTTQGFTLPKDLTDSQMYVRGLAVDQEARVILLKDEIAIGSVSYVNGVATWTLGADVEFDIGEVLEFRSEAAAEFDLLTVSLSAKRAIIKA